MRRYGEAREILREIAVRDPQAVWAASLVAQIELAGKGDLDAAATALRSVSTPVSASAELSKLWHRLNLYARRFDAARMVVEAAPEETFAQRPRALFMAEIEQAESGRILSRAELEKARTELRARHEKDPTGSLAIAEALLGDREAAVRAADELIERAMGGSIGEAIFLKARVLAQLGDGPGAIALLGDERVWASGTGRAVTPSLLKLDPAWHGIRSDPQFQELLKSEAR